MIGLRDLLSKVIKNYHGDDLAGHLAKVLIDTEVIEKEVISIRRARTEERERHSQVTGNLIERENKIQQKCEHVSFTFYGDPSGNGDSYHQCDLCGKMW